MLTLVRLFFFLFWSMLPADSLGIFFKNPFQRIYPGFSLSFNEDSVDDMYNNCHKEMMEKVQSHYLHEEMNYEAFQYAWLSAAECAKKKPEEEDKALTKDHMQAICVYTGEDIYDLFNVAVLSQGPFYSRFQFHSLHFLLTSAIQILNSKKQCHTSYRRTNLMFTGRVNQIIRFGTFASSSYRTDLTQFDSQTCFKIQTCFGAYLKHYPALYGHEEEVLIPPYETFKVTKKIVSPGEYEGLKDCEVFYELKSVGYKSSLNCEALNPPESSATSSSRFEDL